MPRETHKEYALRNKTTGKFALNSTVCNYLKMVPFKKATIWKRKASADMWLKINTNRNDPEKISPWRREHDHDLPVPYDIYDLEVVEITVTRSYKKET